MFFSPFLMISTMKMTMILMLFSSIFFFQKEKNPQFLPNFKTLGLSFYPNLNTVNKNKTFFISILKILTFFSFMPLSLKVAFKSPDMVMVFKNWFESNSFSIPIEFHFDLKFKMFFSVALFVSWSIMEFSFYYMKKDPNPKKFFRLLMMFLLNMIILTSTKNIFLLFMGWEGVGFLSFLLMSWWATRTKAKKSAIQAVIYNRMGDMGMLIFFSMSLTLFKSWSLSEIEALKNCTTYLQYLLLAGALMAAAGKSAQFGLHPWLPAAMEGPTPVSALLHSSTMVVAGMFFLVRMSPIYKNIPMFHSWCLVLGALTAIFAATTAISQHDMKKMIAYSTTSQLGLMMVSIGLNQPNVALFHICTHAFFKAMLFLSSGSMIHSLKDEQDIRKMGGLHFLLPKTSACMLLGSLALSGMPFLSGFYSKDLMLELSFSKLTNLSGMLLSFVATLLTSVYSLRIMYFCFLKPPSFSPLPPTSEENPNLSKALNRLAFGTILSGWFISTFMLIKPTLTIPLILKSLALMITLTGMMFSMSMLSSLSKNFLPYFTNMKNFTSKQWFYEKLSHSLVLWSSFITSLLLSTRNLDRGWSESLGPQGLGNISSSMSQKYQPSQSGYMKQYLVFTTTSFTMIFLSSMMYSYMK